MQRNGTKLPLRLYLSSPVRHYRLWPETGFGSDHPTLLDYHSPGKGLQFSSKRGCKIYTNPSLWLHVLCFGSGRLQRQCQWQSSKLSDRAPVFLEWLIWNTGQYKHSPAHHRQYHWKAKLLHRSQDFIGCHVDFACSGISIGLSMILWLMVCVFWLWNQQPESPEQAAHQGLKSTTPLGCASGSCC